MIYFVFLYSLVHPSLYFLMFYLPLGYITPIELIK